MARKLTFEDRLRRMTDALLPELCTAIRDALPAHEMVEDSPEEFIQGDLDILVTYRRLSTAPWELITHLRNTMSDYKLNAAGRRALKIIDDEVYRRSKSRRS